MSSGRGVSSIVTVTRCERCDPMHDPVERVQVVQDVLRDHLRIGEWVIIFADLFVTSF